jgi:DnaA family protein
MGLQQLALDLPPAEALHTFDSFFAGSNEAAVNALAMLASSPKAPPRGAAYLHGDAGAGKTHLLHAVCAAVSERGARAIYLSAHMAAGDWPVDAQTMTLSDNDWELAALDDCHLFDAAKQRAAFMIYESAIARGMSVVAAGNAPPAQLRLREDLRTRLAWGSSWRLEPLSDADKLLALRSAASARGFDFSDELARWVLTHCSRDMRSLMQLVERIDRFSLGSKRSVTLPLLKAMLGQADGTS